MTFNLADLEAVIKRGLKSFVEVGNALREIRDGRLYKALYSTFEEYCQERWGITRNRAYEQIRASEIVSHAIQNGEDVPKSIREALARGVNQTVKHVLSSDSNEWYTPAEYVEAARKVMGGIDLDPASNQEANADVVKARKYYTEETDGLSQAWGGRVWLNPPYADIGPQFVAKLIEAYNAGHVAEAVLLVNPRTDTAWFQPLFDFTLCFTNGRIKFWKADGSAESPTTGSVFVYLGPNRDRFAEVFSQFGAILERYH